MVSWGYFFGETDEIKVKELQKIFGVEDYEKAKEIYCKIKNDLANKED